MEEDSEIAFKFQLEEVLTASFIDADASYSINYDAVFGANLSNLVQNDNLSKYEQELLDQYKAEAEAKRIRNDLSCQIHDRAFACQVANVPEEEWRRTGEYFNRPYGEGSSSSNGQTFDFRVYVKGLVEQMVGGIGVAICDGHDGLVFEVRKGLSGNEHLESVELVEVKVLIEGLNVSIMLGLNRINVVSDNPLLHAYITGKNRPMQANVAALVDQINLLLRKFNHFHASLVAQNDVKFAYGLARKAMVFVGNRSARNTCGNSTNETCAICLEETCVDQMFLITGCFHSYCFLCMSKHVQFKLQQGILPKCPSENCKSELILDNCKRFLTPQLFDIMSQRVKEACIPAIENIYCPYPRCSALLSKAEIQGYSVNSSSTINQLGATTCPKCLGTFCINCKVPWHRDMTCFTYKILNPTPCSEDEKLKSLATRNLWRQCPKCNHMVSLAEGCYHIYCRCGHESCYTCGAEWRHKKPTCRCPIWDERNIIRGEQNRRE